MTVKVFRPAYTVRLLKLVKRNGDGIAARYSGAEREVDLTPFLSESGAIKIVKGVSDPAGAFTIAIADQPDPSTLDSLYARIEPMDVIEIRGSRTPHSYAGQPLPLLMRGFVSNVRRSESMSSEGTPQRFVTIMGQDAGKLLMINRLFWESITQNPNAPILDQFRFQAATGIEASYLPVAEAMRQLVERVLNRRIAELSAYADRLVQPIRIRATVPQGVVSMNVLAPFQGPYSAVIQLMTDVPWNEAFIEDEEEGPVLIFRPVPFKNIRGEFIVPGAADPGTIELDASQVTTLDVGRSDERVANFYWVPPGGSMLESGMLVTAASIAGGQPFDTSYGNNRPELFGVRKMEAHSILMPDGHRAATAALPPNQRAASGTQILEWHRLRAQQLRDLNRDNSVLEEGSATVQGSELIKPGRFLCLTRGDLVAEAYVPSIVHKIAPLDGWRTEVSLIRGMGFLERLRMEGSPFWREGRKGPYSA